jgi:hypothetical protein
VQKAVGPLGRLFEVESNSNRSELSNGRAADMSSSLLCTIGEEQIRACSLVSMTPMLNSLETLFDTFDEASCFDLNALADELRQEFDLPVGQDAKQYLFQALSKIAERVSRTGSAPSLMLAGDLDHGTVRKEYIEVFNRLSPLVTSTSVRPDFWYKTDIRGLRNIPVLLFEIVSESEEACDDVQSFYQTLLNVVCNTIDMMRLYMNVLKKTEATIMEMSSIVIPKSGKGKICSAVCVTVSWGGADWQFQVSLKPIRINDFVEECANILSNQFKFITEQAIDLQSSYLVRLCNLPAGMEQLQSKHSIVILDASKAGERKILKFTPRPHEREWLLCLCQEANLSAAAKPEKFIRLNGLLFFTYQAVVPPLSKNVVIKCFRGFVVETAKAIRAIHRGNIAHLDVRSFNVGYRIVKPRTGESARAARAVLIDLDRGSCTPSLEATFHTKCAQYARPHGWPQEVVFSAARCDWRQWALMIWSLLDPAQEHLIYSEGKHPLGACPLAFLDGIICRPDVGVDEDELLDDITNWVDSAEMEQAKLMQRELNESDLTTEVRLEWWW